MLQKKFRNRRAWENKGPESLIIYNQFAKLATGRRAGAVRKITSLVERLKSGAGGNLRKTDF